MESNAQPRNIQFGIPSLDELLGATVIDNVATYGITILPSTGKYLTTSLCLLGPDGTGKSVLGLHLASRYCADFGAGCKVLYASMDLSYARALETWEKFGLNRPNRRQIPFFDPRMTPPYWNENKNLELDLRQYIDFIAEDTERVADNNLGTFLRSVPGEQRHVAFIDLEAATTGDDWGFLNRILATLDKPEDNEPRHLMVIDTVEGLEILVGDRDAFGQSRSRRSRIAQILRMAADKCNVVFIVEEPAEGTKLPEEFVTDIVIRLRNFTTPHNIRRTIEIIKARGQAPEHRSQDYTIRDGSGTTTGNQANPDDPPIENETGNQAYFHVFHSLQHITYKRMRRTADRDPQHWTVRDVAPLAIEKWMPFGIKYLDNMLGHGLPAGTITALIGDDGTHKSRIGRAFLSGCFTTGGEIGNNKPQNLAKRHYSRQGKDNKKKDKPGVAVLLTAEDMFAEGLAERLWQHLPIEERAERRQTRKPNAPIEFTANEIDQPAKFAGELLDGYIGLSISLQSLAQDQYMQLRQKYENFMTDNEATREQLSQSLVDYLNVLLTQDLAEKCNQNDLREEVRYLFDQEIDRRMRNRLVLEDGYPDYLQAEPLRQIAKRIVCRRLDLHEAFPATLFHIVRCAINEAKQRLQDEEAVPSKRLTNAWRIRLVIDNWSTIKDTYPAIANDPLFLPFLLRYLKLEGISTLLIDTQPGSPRHIMREETDKELRALVDHHLYTWQVPFFGENRVAIAAIPPISDKLPTVVRELCASGHDNSERLEVDPHFELYAGLEEGKPSLVPLTVRLYAETPAFWKYVKQTNSLFSMLFSPVVPATRRIGTALLLPPHRLNDVLDSQPDSSPGADLPAPTPFSDTLDLKIGTEEPARLPEAQIVFGQREADYERMHDYSYLQKDTRSHFTEIFQIDEHWFQRPGESYPEADYLSAEVDAQNDPFGIFQPSLLEQKVHSINGDKIHRFQLFNTVGYRYTKEGEENCEKVQTVDRVPYMWDFGFLLCRRMPWKVAEEQLLVTRNMKVKDVWDRLPHTYSQANEQHPCSWRDFLEACRVVAEHWVEVHQNENENGADGTQNAPSPREARAFDLDMLGPETLSCLFLEIWMSEIEERRKPDRQNAEHAPDPQKLTTRTSTLPEQGLLHYLQAYPDELYKTCLLLSELLESDQLPRDDYTSDYQPRNVHYSAVAARHWYSTACDVVQQIENDPDRSKFGPMIPVGLPGRFSVRGDWFLGITRGSRSVRLGHRAIDLLSSRRANVTRLRFGLGLPTRTILQQYQSQLRTALITCDDRDEMKTTLMYEYLLHLGAGDFDAPQREDFYWLWRSRIKGYSHHTRIWQKWLLWVLSRWRRHLTEDYHRGDGFKLYDALSKVPDEAYASLRDKASFREQFHWFQEHHPWFEDKCAVLCESLESATPIPR